MNEAAAAGDAAKAAEATKKASRDLDKAVSKGVIHKNQAANRKSAVAKGRRLRQVGPTHALFANPRHMGRC